MLLSVTPSPAIDRSLYVPSMRIGSVHRALEMYLAAGGKGINVARVARTINCEAIVTGVLSGCAGQMVADLAAAEGLVAEWHWMQGGETRTSTLINHESGDATVINEEGPPITSDTWDVFSRRVTALAHQSEAVALAGSLPIGSDTSAFAEFVRSLGNGDRRIYVDTSEGALRAILAEPRGVCIKVNQSELASTMELEPAGHILARLRSAGEVLLGRGAAMVVVTLGAQGALAITPEGAWKVSPPPVEVVSTVGCGDSLLAGLITGHLQGRPTAEATALGVACGSANTLSRLPGHVERTDIDAVLSEVVVTELH